MKPVIGLKIEVNTLRGLKEGVPQLMALLQKHSANASFLFSVGRDHTPGIMKRTKRLPWFKKLGTKDYGFGIRWRNRLWPLANLGKVGGKTMQSVLAAGFDVGMLPEDGVEWLRRVSYEDNKWVRENMQQSFDRLKAILGQAPTVHGASWMCQQAFRTEQLLGFQYGSDTYGVMPFWPVVEGEYIRCVQVPTTLPTLAALLNDPEVTRENAAEKMLEYTQMPSAQVFAIRAEFEGRQLLSVFEAVLEGWIQQGYQIVSIPEFAKTFDPETLPYHEVEIVKGRMLQGNVFMPEQK